ncbi:MAG: hypothetical protein IJ693_02620 [Bacteroidaceae bacterium]|nr:hypothetical protein [Bacteroidaceae bacterium]
MTARREYERLHVVDLLPHTSWTFLCVRHEFSCVYIVGLLVCAVSFNLVNAEDEAIP